MNNPDRIIRLKTVLARTGLSRTTLYRKRGEGPSRAKLRQASTGSGGESLPSIVGSPIRLAIARNRAFDPGDASCLLRARARR